MNGRIIIALDGHDGAGKTTLAAALALALGGAAVRPFSGTVGAELLQIGENKDVRELIRVGSAAIENAISSVPGGIPVILDRGWMTVASFVPDSTDFFAQWNIWVPTVLCWAELSTTLSRLALRHNEISEPNEWHEHYLAIYMELARRSESLILRTDLIRIETCVKQLVAWVKNGFEAQNDRLKACKFG